MCKVLTASSDQKYASIERQTSAYKPLETYALEKEKHYQQQFGDMYFLRLTKLKPAVDRVAEEAWDDFHIGGEAVEKVERVLDVRQGKLCWVSGTIYMEMPLKPNILDDISKDVSLDHGRDKTEVLMQYSIGFQLLHLDRNTYPPPGKTLLCWRMNLDDCD